MGVSRVINRRTAVLGLLLVILATAGFGFAATNNVQNSRAGDGEGDIAGFNVTDISYGLNATDPEQFASVSFDIAGGQVVPTKVKARIGTGTWSAPCTTSDGTMAARFTCVITGDVESAATLQVVAVQ
jgi:hypothetical protein